MWKLQMAAYLQVHKLMGIVEGTVERPVEAKPQEIWDTNDALAKLAILTTIDVGQHEYVSSAKTSATMWSNLLTVYERVDSTKKINILREYHRYSYDGSNIAKHIARVENLAQQCDTVGETQSETNVLAKMLDGLPDRFSAVVTTWGIVPERDQTRNTLKRMLLEAEARTASVNSETEQALAVTNRPVAKSVAETTGKPRKDKKNKKDIECFKCHKRGHYALECWSNQSKKKTDTLPEKRTDVSSSTKTEPSCFIIGALKNSEQSRIADSGVSCHMVNDRSWFSDLNSMESTLKLADQGTIKAAGIGKVPIEKCINGRWELAYLLDVLYVPSLRKNLFSIGAAARRGVNAYICDGRIEFKRDGQIELEAVQTDNNTVTMIFRKPVPEANTVIDLQVWHERLGHISLQRMREMMEADMIPGLKISTNAQLICESCMYGKMTKLPFSKCEKRSFVAGEMWHSDVNTMPLKSWGGNRYYVNFVDDTTGFQYIHFMKHKDEVLKNFINHVKSRQLLVEK